MQHIIMTWTGSTLQNCTFHKLVSPTKLSHSIIWSIFSIPDDSLSLLKYPLASLAVRKQHSTEKFLCNDMTPDAKISSNYKKYDNIDSLVKQVLTTNSMALLRSDDVAQYEINETLGNIYFL